MNTKINNLVWVQQHEFSSCGYLVLQKNVNGMETLASYCTLSRILVQIKKNVSSSLNVWSSCRYEDFRTETEYFHLKSVVVLKRYRTIILFQCGNFFPILFFFRPHSLEIKVWNQAWSGMTHALSLSLSLLRPQNEKCFNLSMKKARSRETPQHRRATETATATYTKIQQTDTRKKKIRHFHRFYSKKRLQESTLP